MRSGLARERRTEAREQFLRLQWLRQIAADARMERAGSGCISGVCGHDDRRQWHAAAEQVLMQVEPRHAWHPHVREQAGGLRTATGLQEGRRTCEFCRYEAERSDKGGNGLASRLVVVNDRYESLVFQLSLRRSPRVQGARRTQRPLPRGVIPPTTTLASGPGRDNYTKVSRPTLSNGRPTGGQRCEPVPAATLPAFSPLPGRGEPSPSPRQAGAPQRSACSAVRQRRAP